MKTPTIVTLILLAAGCTVTRPPGPSVAGDSAASVKFCGIKQSLDIYGSARLLIVHGMGDHPTYDYDESLRAGLRDSLHLQPAGCTGPYPISRETDKKNTYGGVLRCTYQRSDGAKLRTFTLLWHPLTLPYKVGGLQHDWDLPLANWRPSRNHQLKRNLIDRSFSDAIMYAGDLREPMRYTVRQAICAAVTDQIDLGTECTSQPPDSFLKRDLYIATHSLGSIMLFETLGIMTSEAAAASATAANRALVERVQLVAMLANQLPLIALSRRKEPPVDGVLAQPEFTLQRYLQSLFERRVTPIPVIAFTDMNDLLSFTIPDNWRQTLFPDIGRQFVFVNYFVVNVRHALFGVTNPLPAHTGYWNNNTVIDAIANGCGC